MMVSRAGYSDDNDNPACYLWGSIVDRAAKGKRGRAFLTELAAALDAMPVKELVANELEMGGQFCTLGAICHAKGISLADIAHSCDWPTAITGITCRSAALTMTLHGANGAAFEIA
jgi:hypothetical protein